MDDKDWEMLILLREEKSISKAAEKLYLSQPALTYRLDQLEKKLGAQLFIRSKKGIQFTSAGERLLSCAERMLREFLDIKKYITANEGEVTGMLRLGASAAFAHNQLPLLLKGFNQRFPAVDICLYTGLSNDILKQLFNEELAIAIIRGNHPWSEADVLLQSDSLCLISAKPLELRDLPSIPGISYQTDPTMKFQVDSWWQENFTSPPKILMHVDSASTCRQLVFAGLGWAIMPSLRLPEQISDLFVKEIKDKHNQQYLRPTRMIYRHAVKKLDAPNAFINYIFEHFSINNSHI